MKAKLTLIAGLLSAAFCSQALAQNTVVTYQGHVQSNGTNFHGPGQFKFALVTSTNTAVTATANANLSGAFVTSYTITGGGSGYVTPPTVTVSGGGGSGAIATAVISGGVVTAINPVAAGSGYSGPPTVTIAPPPATILYTTYWSNDGTSSAGSEPGAAVSVPVADGLFTVGLGNAALANMTALSAALFQTTNLQLRLWFNNGVNGFAALSPLQNLTAAPYANYAYAATTLTTASNQPLNFVINGNNVLRITSVLDQNGLLTANSVGGSAANVISNGVAGGFIGGGGEGSFFPNRVGAHYASVLGGSGNTASGYGSTAMGYSTTASGQTSTAMGDSTTASGQKSTAMGIGTIASGSYSTVMGFSNTASGYASTGMGNGNIASGQTSTAMGSVNTATGHISTAMGAGNTAGGDYSTAMGGNTTASGFSSTAMGLGTTASGSVSTSMGYQTTASANYATAMGSRANANHSGSFVWSDAQPDEFSSTANNQFLIRAGAGVGINKNNPATALDVNGTITATTFSGGVVGIGTPNPQGSLHVYSANNPTVVRIQNSGTPGFGRVEFVSNPQGDANEWRPGYIQSTDAGGFIGGMAFVVNGAGVGNKFAEVETMRIQNGRVGIGNSAPSTLLQVGNATCNGTTWINASDRNIKENFKQVDARAVLEKVAALPIQSWSYTNDVTTRHLGPMAQDFYAAFGAGTDDKHIATVDADGVALAAIQGLNEKVESGKQKAENRMASLEAENAALKQRLEKLERLVNLQIARH